MKSKHQFKRHHKHLMESICGKRKRVEWKGRKEEMCLIISYFPFIKCNSIILLFLMLCGETLKVVSSISGTFSMCSRSRLVRVKVWMLLSA